jgi:hypothetical protein
VEWSALDDALADADDAAEDDTSAPPLRAALARRPRERTVILTRPQHDERAQRILFFATTTMDLFGLASPAHALSRTAVYPISRRPRADAPRPAGDAPPAFHWFLLHDTVSAAALRDRGSHSLRDVALDAMLAVGVAEVSVVSESTPATLRLEISLSGSKIAAKPDRKMVDPRQGRPYSSRRTVADFGGDDDATDTEPVPSADASGARGVAAASALQRGVRYTVGIEVRDCDGMTAVEVMSFTIPERGA